MTSSILAYCQRKLLSSLESRTTNHGCQLSDFSLRSQTFFYTSDLSTTFYICLKSRLFGTSHHKTTSKHTRIQEFWLCFAKYFFDSRQKREKRPHPADSSCAWPGLWHAVKRTLSISRSFQTFVKHNVGYPAANFSGRVRIKSLCLDTHERFYKLAISKWWCRLGDCHWWQFLCFFFLKPTDKRCYKLLGFRLCLRLLAWEVALTYTLVFSDWSSFLIVLAVLQFIILYNN